MGTSKRHFTGLEKFNLINSSFRGVSPITMSENLDHSSAEKKRMLQEHSTDPEKKSKNHVRDTMQSLLEANNGIPRSIIFADCPWSYGNSKDSSLMGLASAQYDTMSLNDICALDIKKIAAKNCILLMWTTGPHMKSALTVIDAWGFSYKTMYEVWVKTTKGEMRRNRLGYYTKQCAEYVLLATRGHPIRLKKTSKSDDERAESFANVFFADSTRHSEKPRYPYEVVDQMFHDVPRIELFGRTWFNEGWDCWGAQLEQIVDGTAQQRIAERRKMQLDLAQRLDEATSTGSWGGIRYDVDDIEYYLDQSYMDSDKEDVDRFEIVREHKDYFAIREQRVDLTERYNLRRK